MRTRDGVLVEVDQIWRVCADDTFVLVRVVIGDGRVLVSPCDRDGNVLHAGGSAYRVGIKRMYEHATGFVLFR